MHWPLKPTSTHFFTSDRARRPIQGKWSTSWSLLVLTSFFFTFPPSDDVHGWDWPYTGWFSNIVPKTRFAKKGVQYTRASVIRSFSQVVGGLSRTDCDHCLCIWSPLCLGVWDDTVSNYIMNTRCPTPMICIVWYKDEAPRDPPRIVVSQMIVETIDV